VELYPREALADEEPRYLRRQKPVEIKRRKFGRQAWKTYLRLTMWTAVGLAAGAAAYECGRFLLGSPDMALLHPDQIRLEGNHYVTAEAVRKIFVPDRGLSVLRIPISERRHELETISWVEQATVHRILPNRIQVEITERTPVAFLRDHDELSLVDAEGVILERPVAGDFHFPVITGISREMSLEDRRQRMQLFSTFMQEIGRVKAGAADQVSEVDLSDERDLRATLTGLDSQDPSASGSSAALPIVVHFGDSDFAGKYQILVNEFGTWQATAGRIESVDLRFSREAVVSQDTSASASPMPGTPGRSH
jgi:cell division protein FtsQ